MEIFWKVLWVIVLIMNVLAGIAAIAIGSAGSAISHFGIAGTLYLIYVYLKD